MTSTEPMGALAGGGGRIAGAIAVLMTVASCAGAGAADPVRSELRIPGEPLASLTVELTAGVGEVHVRAGCEELVVGTIDYDAGHAEPEVTFERKEGHGRLILRPRTLEGSRGDGSFRWDLCLGGGLPLYVRAVAGVGDTQLDLREARLRRLDVVAGVGDVRVQLPAPDRADVVVDVAVEGGVGNVKLEAPADAPLRLRVAEGVGDVRVSGFRHLGEATWVGPGWSADATPRVEIAADVGVGDLRLDPSSDD